MNLNDLKPRQAKLKVSGVKRQMTLNPITLADEAWLSQNFSPEEIERIFNTLEVSGLARIVFRLLDIDSKKIFAKQDVTFVTEDGDTLEGQLGGYELLMYRCVGIDDKMAIVNALLEIMGISRPEINKEAKKKAKKKVQGKQTGRKSSTK